MTARTALHCPTCTALLGGDESRCPVCGSALGSACLPEGTMLAEGRYTLEAVLGQGGFGITYGAQDHSLGRRVALKELFPEGSSRLGGRLVPPPSLGHDGFLEARRNFLEESRRLAGFAHPGIVRVHDTFEQFDTAYLVMELLEGQTLAQRLERSGRLSAEEVQALALELAGALEGVHASGLLHRDLKPDNVFLTSSGRTVLIDFGSARAFAGDQTSTLTRLVTTGYAPPEQYATRAKFGAYTDLYALSATLYHALTGELPPGATDRMLGAALPPLLTRLPTLERTPQAQALVRAIEQGLELRVEARPQSALEFVRQMRARPPGGPGITRAAPPALSVPDQPSPLERAGHAPGGFAPGVVLGVLLLLAVLSRSPIALLGVGTLGLLVLVAGGAGLRQRLAQAVGIGVLVLTAPVLLRMGLPGLVLLVVGGLLLALWHRGRRTF